MINIPSEELKLPSEINKKIENVRNNITVLEAEANNLKKVCAAERYTIGELSKEKTELNEGISNLIIKSELSKTKLELSEKSYIDKSKELDELNKKFRLISDAIVLLEENKKKTLSVLEKKEYNLNVREKEITLREKNVLEKEIELKNKEEKLKQFALGL